jgi:hypothetical protein
MRNTSGRGEFFAPMPLGESLVPIADRVEGRGGSGYSDRLVFDGFEHAAESPQARREEGHVG